MPDLDVLAAIADEAERAHRKINLGNDVVHDLGADMFGLDAHLIHHPGTLNRIGIARIIFHIGSDHQLAALLQAGHDDRLQIGAGSIDRRCITGGTGTDDKNGHMALRHNKTLNWYLKR